MAKVNLKKHERKIVVRRLRQSDYEDVRRLQQAVFPNVAPCSREQFYSQLRTSPAGQLGVEIEVELVAISSSMLITGDAAMSVHDFDEITGDSYIRGHDEKGDYLYGIDIAILPEFQGQKLARRLYEARKDIVRRRNLKGMLIGGRIPGYHKYADQMSAEEYVDKVCGKEIRDPVLYAQLANDFEIRRVMPDYLPEDTESCGYAVLMEWSNPDYTEESDREIAKSNVRLCVVQ
jgi:GNAT superfamily N-acetyltransferase